MYHFSYHTWNFHCINLIVQLLLLKWQYRWQWLVSRPQKNINRYFILALKQTRTVGYISLYDEHSAVLLSNPILPSMTMTLSHYQSSLSFHPLLSHFLAVFLFFPSTVWPDSIKLFSSSNPRYCSKLCFHLNIAITWSIRVRPSLPRRKWMKYILRSAIFIKT